MMNSQEVETAVRLSLSLVVLILNDSLTVHPKQEELGFPITVIATRLVTYAKSYGDGPPDRKQRSTGTDLE